MSEAPIPQPQHQGPNKVKLPCFSCHQEMEVVMPIPRIANAIDVSTVAFVHNRPDICPHCKTMFLPMIEGINEEGTIFFKWNVVSANRQPLIVGGNDNALKRAIENANLTEQIKKGH